MFKKVHFAEDFPLGSADAIKIIKTHRFLGGIASGFFSSLSASSGVHMLQEDQLSFLTSEVAESADAVPIYWHRGNGQGKHLQIYEHD